MRKLRKIKPATVLLMMYDIFAVLIASGLSLLIRFELRWTAVESVFWDSIVTYCVINIVTTVVVFYFFPGCIPVSGATPGSGKSCR